MNINVYRFVGLAGSQVKPTAANCQKILKQAQLDQWAMGRSKVFLKYWHSERLMLVINRYGKHAVMIQKWVRRFVARRKYLRARAQVIVEVRNWFTRAPRPRFQAILVSLELTIPIMLTGP